MIYGDQDPIQRSANLEDFVPNVDVVSLDCGHWIQQENPNEMNEVLLDWLQRQDGAHSADDAPHTTGARSE